MSGPDDSGIEPFDWYNRFFGKGRRGFGFGDFFKGFDEIEGKWKTNLNTDLET